MWGEGLPSSLAGTSEAQVIPRRSSVRRAAALTASAATIVVAALALAGCSSPDRATDGPLVAGSGAEVPDTSICLPEVSSNNRGYLGARAENTSSGDLTITSITPTGVDGIVVEAIDGRVMSSDDPHFAGATDRDISDPQFARAFEGLASINNVQVPAGESIGIVVTVVDKNPDEKGTMEALRIEYEAGDEDYVAMTTQSLVVSTGSCE